MSRRLHAAALATAALATVLAAATPTLAMKSAPAKGAYATPHNAWGQPDLQGVWSNATLTPFERPKGVKDLVLSDDQAGSIVKENAKFKALGAERTDPSLKTEDLPKDCGRGFTGTNCGYNSGWTDPGDTVLTIDGHKRSSILTTNGGHMPAPTDAGRKYFAGLMAIRATGRSYENPEWRGLGERCIMSFGQSAGPPMLPLLYNNNYQIFQNKDEVLINVEMVHDVRHVRLNSEHAPASVRSWMGDSIGRWEGNTLVIETTNFRGDQLSRGGSTETKVTEWLTRVSPREIMYRFKVEDPTLYAEPYGGELVFNAQPGRIYEYACHEGNYALHGILAGARANEAKGLPPGGAGENAKRVNGGVEEGQ